VRFEKWLVANDHPAILASLERSILIAYRQFLETVPQQPRGSIRCRRGGLLDLADDPSEGQSRFSVSTDEMSSAVGWAAVRISRHASSK